jgi:hypothetical protein
MLEDWNEESVFPAGVLGVGGNSGIPIWFYNWKHYFRALIICRLKGQGRKRFSEIRVILWFRGIDIPGGPPREDLASEFARCIKNLLRPISSTYEPTCNEDEDKARATRLRQQLGPQSPLFKNTFLEARDDWMLAGYKEGRFDEPQKIVSDFENDILRQLTAELGMDRQAVPEIDRPTGLMAHPDECENGGISLIRNSSDPELNGAREMCRAFLALPSLMKSMGAIGWGDKSKIVRELSATIPALKNSARVIPAWRLILLVNFLSFQKQDPDGANSIRNVDLFNNINELGRNS